MLQILHFSDCHLFADPTQELRGVQPASTLTAVLDAAQEQAAASQIAIITGDLTDDGQPETYARVEQMFARLQRPVYAVPGNHDEADAMRKGLTGHPIVWQRSVVVAGWHLIFLNSADPGQVGGVFLAEELAALEEALLAQPNLPTLIAFHHQPVPVATPWMDQIGLAQPEHFFALLARHPWTRCVLFGHIHSPFDGHWQNVRLLSAPATSVQFARGTEQPICTTDTPGYRWLRLHPDGQLETGIVRT
ncbi:MAG: phosphodiesterase [Magnetococcales bacterium]|nr:phosphodiesterase [Magnetococcales bacterium]